MERISRVTELDRENGQIPQKQQKRDRTEVNADVLKVCRKGATRTQIVYQANLNFKVLVTYLARLMGADLLKQDGRLYFTTGAGEEFIYHAERVRI